MRPTTGSAGLLVQPKNGDGWTVAFENGEGEVEGQRETLCTVGNGRWATRGALPECGAGDDHYPGTYVAGLYNRLPSQVSDRVTEDESLVNVPNWLPFTVAAQDSPWLGEDSIEMLEDRHELDLRAGILIRRFRFQDPAGRITRVEQRRFTHLERHEFAALQTVITPENWSGVLKIRSGIDAGVKNFGVPRYRQLGSHHLQVEDLRHVGHVALAITETIQSKVRIAVAARLTLRDADGVIAGDRLTVHQEIDDAWIGHEAHVTVVEGASVIADKIAVLTTSRDAATSSPEESALTLLSMTSSVEELSRSHDLAWLRLWQRFHIDVEAGGPVEVATLRLYAYHLIISMYGVGAGNLDAGVPARGLHGEAYRGHIFWDELFIFPILNLRLPWVCRALLRYRIRRLDAARAAAVDAGLEGALFPWQSGSDGSEQTPRVHLNPDSGRWLPDVTHLQRHVGLAIAYNVMHYFQVSGDYTFLEQEGAEIILEITRCFASLTTFDADKGRFVINGVIGPDEFHTAYPGADEPGINNNAYTNIMTVWLMRAALEVLNELPEPRRAELVEKLSIADEEMIRWSDISEQMFVPFHVDPQTGRQIISQFEGYEDLAELDWEGLAKRHGSVSRLDRILEAEDDSVNNYQAAKQADVLMLPYLHSAAELEDVLQQLGYDWTTAQLPDTIDYYLERTSHGSTLSTVVHSWVLARSKREDAINYLDRTLRADLEVTQAGTTSEGIHLAGMCGAIDLVQRCFGGIEVRRGALWFDPMWPVEFGELEFTMRYRRHTLLVRINGRNVEVEDVGGPAQSVINVGFDSRSQSQELHVGEMLRHWLPPDN